jgi:uncharacterized protein Usg
MAQVFHQQARMAHKLARIALGVKTMSQSNLLLKGYRLTTAEISYSVPDHPDRIQKYIWQEMDIAPKFPILREFLEFWHNEIEGELQSVHVDAGEMVDPKEFSKANKSLSIH